MSGLIEVFRTSQFCERTTHNVCCRDDHYPVCRLDIRQDSEFATGYGYLKTAFKREHDTDPDIRNAFMDNSNFWKKLHNHLFIVFNGQWSMVYCFI